MPDRSKGGFNRIAGANTLPMLGRKVEECHELFAVFLQAEHRLGILGLVGFDEQIKGLVRVVLGLGLPDIVYGSFSLWLRQLWQAIEHVHRLVLPATLVAGRGVDLIHGSPEPHGTVSDSQFGGIHPPTFEAEQNLAPALSGLAHSVLDRQEPLLATSCHTNNYKGAELVVGAAQAAMNTVSPDINDWLIVQRSFSPAIILGCPTSLEARHRVSGSARRIRAEQDLEGSAHLTTGNTFKVQPGQGGFQRLGSTHVGRN